MAEFDPEGVKFDPSQVKFDPSQVQFNPKVKSIWSPEFDPRVGVQLDP